MPAKNKCVDCGRSIQAQSTRCRKCRGKQLSIQYADPTKTPNYKGGRSCKSICLDCGSKVHRIGSKRCKKCWVIYYRGSNHHGWKGGWPKCVDCGKKISRSNITGRCSKCLGIFYRAHPSENPHYAILWTDAMRERASIAHRGKKSSWYIHGEGNEPYLPEFNKILKEKIRRRDGHKCMLCGITEHDHIKETGKVLSIHHIDYDKKNNNEHNLITLCTKCNLKVNKNIEYWIEYFTRAISSIYSKLRSVCNSRPGSIPNEVHLEANLQSLISMPELVHYV